MPPNQGLVHPKEYDIKDSNVELIGTDIDHQVKYNSAATEPAWHANGIGSAPGLYIWRIEQFEVVPWPKDKYGQFLDGDSFIVLHSYKIGEKEGNEKLGHDIFFWLGAHTTQDEAGTAAYKTVEVDEFLGGAATQHREVQQSPSDDFLALFPRLSIRSGGVRSGFRHVAAEDEADKEEILTLLRVFKNPAAGSGANGIIVHEVEPTWNNLDDTDVFILDTGEKIWVWQGKDCSPMEKAKAAQVVHDMTLAKHIDVEVLSQTESRSRRVLNLLGADDNTPTTGLRKRRPVSSFSASSSKPSNKKLFRLSDASGELTFELVKDGGRITPSDFDGNDVFLLDDAGKAVWVWIGGGASKAEKATWMRVAQAYIRRLQSEQQEEEEEEETYLVPVAKVKEGAECKAFRRAIEA
jgi:gelsolin